MSPLERLHERWVSLRRVQILAAHFARLIPRAASVLDIGSGDGRLARCIQDARPDISIVGLDVLVREQTAIPVRPFDGQNIPYDPGSFDLTLFVDVLHHTTDPLVLLRESARVSRVGLLIKDHLREGRLAQPTLRVMDWMGNQRHGVALPYNYWSRAQWDGAIAALQLKVGAWEDRLGLYPWPAKLIFERSLHFISLLRVPSARGGAS
jgi:SAM-dependent methyltransferase